MIPVKNRDGKKYADCPECGAECEVGTIHWCRGADGKSEPVDVCIGVQTWFESLPRFADLTDDDKKDMPPSAGKYWDYFLDEWRKACVNADK